MASSSDENRYYAVENGHRISSEWPWYLHPAHGPTLSSKTCAIAHAREYLKQGGFNLPEAWQGEPFEYYPGRIILVYEATT